MALLTGFLDPEDDFWVDDLYDMDDAQLRSEAERYTRIAKKYEQTKNKQSLGESRLSYQFAYLRYKEVLKILESKSDDTV